MSSSRSTPSAIAMRRSLPNMLIRRGTDDSAPPGRHGALEQQRRSPAFALHAPVGDLGDLQLDAHGPRDANQFALALEGRYELG